MIRIALVICLVGTLPLLAGSDDHWKAILALDAGPRQKPATAGEAREAALRHLALQRSSLEEFLEKYPRDSRAWEARLRLASVLATLGMTGPDIRQLRAARQLYSAIAENPSAPSSARADAAFRKASLAMQEADASSPKGREAIVAAARAFHLAHPGDIRGPRILVEAATVCDGDPKLKRALLDRALADSSEPALRARIADDLRRLDLLGKALDLSIPALKGGTLELAALRGNPVILIFWSSESPQSLLWLRDFRTAWESAPRRPRVVAISLDRRKSDAFERAQLFPSEWLAAYEPGGWEAPTARRLGINALPTVWIVDAEGRLRSLNARADWQQQLAGLSR